MTLGGRRIGSLRGKLLLWLLVPMAAVVAVSAVSAYRNAVRAANLAYDRSLLASARAIADRVTLVGSRLMVDVPYAAIDIFEADTPDRIYYRVTGFGGEFVAGYDDFPPLPPGTPRSDAYPALVHFYDGTYRDEPLRAAALYQPVSGPEARGMILIQVGETLEARRLFARAILVETVTRQSLLVLLAAVSILFVVHGALRPLLRLRSEVAEREPDDLRPFDEQQVHPEIRPLVQALNQYTDRLRRLLESRRRFIADASHQLRTPLAALKTQTEVALRSGSPDDMREAVEAIHATTDETVRLTQQLLSLARAEPGGARRALVEVDLTALARQVCLERSAEAVRRGIDLGFEGEPAAISGEPVMLHELLANLVDNALRYAPVGGTATVRVRAGDAPRIEVEDSGPGIPPELRQRVFERF
jgi:two-component system sensor histidine kinase TctE